MEVVSVRTRRRALRALSSAARVLAWLLLRVLPARRHAVVHGWPDSEGNAVETLRALTRRYDGTVVWLLDDPSTADRVLGTAGLPEGRVRRVTKGSLRAVGLCLTAELTFFTHGLYTAVSPPRSRLVVNLWHGDGPKATRDTRLVRSSVVVAGTRLFGEYKRRLFAVPQRGLAVVGNPRVDQFWQPVPAEALLGLGLRPSARRVLWLPTYRQARGPRAREWSDGSSLTANEDVRRLAEALAAAAAALGLDLLVKPHPLDLDGYDGLGIRVVRDADLQVAGLTLYQLMGTCDALLSDVSSAWTDFLALDRPVGFYIPDLEELQSRRGLNVDDLETLLPGPRVVTPGDAEEFLGGVAHADAALRPSAWPGTRRIGPVPASPSRTADGLLDWLDDLQAERGGRRLFAPAPETS